jgi:hypothetical protein
MQKKIFICSVFVGFENSQLQFNTYKHKRAKKKSVYFEQTFCRKNTEKAPIEKKEEKPKK